jgi:adenylate cyclase
VADIRELEDGSTQSVPSNSQPEAYASNGGASSSSGNHSPAPTAVHEALEKILASQTFRAAEGQKNFLRYAVEETLAGRGPLIKEYSVGTAVFDRGESFDPRLDTIVRTEARKLRARLTKYYESEGINDAVRIEFVKGKYSPVFHLASEFPVTAPVEQISGPEPGPPASTSSVTLPLPETSTAAPRRNWTAAVVLAALIVAGALFWWTRRSAVPATGEGPSIAVLPFLNLSEGKEDEYFSDGLTEELIDSLARVPGLHVVARTSAFQYKGKTQDVRKIGQELNVRSVLEGSVRKSGSRVRITAQLVNTGDGYHLWSSSYDREFKDALTIQREISQAIVNALEAQYTSTVGWDKSKVNRFVTSNAEAYEDYLKGRYFWQKVTGDNMKTAINYFQQAVAKDPNFALAYEGLARCYAGIPGLTSTPLSVVLDDLRNAANKALELDPALGPAHTDLGYGFALSYEWDSADKELKKGVELTPGDEFAHRLYGIYLSQIGRFEDALKEDETALRLDPVSPFMSQSVGRTLMYLHRYDQAIEQFRKALMLDPNYGSTHEGLGLAYLYKGMREQGLKELKTAYDLRQGGATFTSSLGYGYAVSGKTAEAQQILKDLTSQSNGKPVPAMAIARVYIGLGDKDRAFMWLSTALDQHSGPVQLKGDPIFDPLRQDPRFAEILKKAKLN